MAADSALLNTLQPDGPARSVEEGDVPDVLRRRYLTERGRLGAGLGFYVDGAVVAPSFRDRGGQLYAARTDPNTIRDMVAIAQHRGWSTIEVRGATGFRREAWLAGQVRGLAVRGYQPSERDRQDLLRRQAAQDRRRSDPDAPAGPAPRQDPTAPGPRAHLKIVEAVVRDRVTDPDTQARILAAARSRVADLLERGARFEDLRDRTQDRSGRERRR
jgi:hypothetical protein